MLIKSIGFSVQPRMNNKKANSQNVAFKGMKIEEVLMFLESNKSVAGKIRDMSELELKLEKVLFGKKVDKDLQVIAKAAVISEHVERLLSKRKYEVFEELSTKEIQYNQKLANVSIKSEDFKQIVGQIVKLPEIANSEFAANNQKLLMSSDLIEDTMNRAKLTLEEWSALWREVYGFQKK